MKYVNGYTVYEENDICSLDEYSEQLANDLKMRVNDTLDWAQFQVRQLLFANSANESKILKLQIENTALQAETERLRSDLNLSTATVKGSGESVTLKGTSGARFKKLGISGNSWQETRSGKNLLENTATTTTNNGITYTVNKDGTVTVNGTATATSSLNIKLNFELADGVGYILSGCPSGGSSDSYQLLILQYYSSAVHYGYDYGNGANFTYNIASKSSNRIQIVIPNGVTVNNLVFKPMIRLATETDDTYEQYGVQPSLNYPSTIRNCGENVNEFDSEDWYTTLKALNSDSMTKETVDGIEYYKFKPTTNGGQYNYKYMQGQFKENTQYKFFCKARQYDQTSKNSTGFVIRYTDGTNTSVFIQRTLIEYNYEIISEVGKTIDSIYLAFANDYFVLVRNIKLTEVITDNSYSPYNCGNANVVVGNKNLATLALGKYGDYRILNPIPVKKGEKVTLIVKYSSSYNAIYPRLTSDENLKEIIQSWDEITSNNEATRTYTMPSDGYFTLGSGYTWSYYTFSELMVAIGEYTSSEYVEHQEQDITFPLSEGQRLYKGSYLAEDGIHHVNKSREMNEMLDTLTLYNIDKLRYTFRLGISDIDIARTTAKQIEDIMCSHIIASSSGENTSEYEEIWTMKKGNGTSNIWIFAPKSFFQGTTNAEILAEFKDYINQQKTNGTPIILEYKVAEEIIEPYTTEQQEVWDYIEKIAHSYEGTTYIKCLDETSLNFEVEAVMSMNTIVDAILSLGGNI